LNPLRVDAGRAGDGTVLVLAGELDLSTVVQAEELLLRVEHETNGPLTVDLSDLTFIDSTGLRLILSAHARATERGRPFAIVRGPDAVHRVFHLTRLEERLPFTDASPIRGGGEPG
jgi:anti-anti-sigma factor